MAKLTSKSWRVLEDAFEMHKGSVLTFTNREFANFMGDFDVDIYDNLYSRNGTSKANRLRAFLEMASEPLAARTIRKLWQYRLDINAKFGISNDVLLEKSVEDIIDAFEGISGSSIDGIDNFAEDPGLEEIVGSIRRDIEAGKHVMALDRLHTYCMKRFAFLLDRRGIDCTSTEPLHSRVGKYAKAIAAEAGHHEMTAQIVRNGFGIFEKFNDVRNNKSPAHDNDLIGASEAKFIFEFVCAYLRFVKRLEGE
jgi:hypothetical protein